MPRSATGEADCEEAPLLLALDFFFMLLFAALLSSLSLPLPLLLALLVSSLMKTWSTTTTLSSSARAEEGGETSPLLATPPPPFSFDFVDDSPSDSKPSSLRMKVKTTPLSPRSMWQRTSAAVEDFLGFPPSRMTLPPLPPPPPPLRRSETTLARPASFRGPWKVRKQERKLVQNSSFIKHNGLFDCLLT